MNKRISLISLILIFIISLSTIKINSTPVYYGSFKYATLLQSSELIRKWGVDNNTYNNNTVSTWTSGDGVNDIQSLTSDSDYIYAGGYVSPGKVSKINLSLKIFYEVWNGATRVYYSTIEPDINDFITVTLPIQVEETTSMTFTHWLILLFAALVISLLSAIKFHIIATVSFILVIYMIINVASFTGIILLAIIVWLLTIMFSIIAFMEI